MQMAQSAYFWEEAIFKMVFDLAVSYEVIVFGMILYK